MAWGPDMSEEYLWNPTIDPDKAGRPDMSGPRAVHVRGIPLEPDY
jgi:hypothetical protein